MQLLNKIFFVAILLLSSMVMYTCARAQNEPFGEDQVIGFYDDGSSITFGEYFDDVEAREPAIIDYCRLKANVGMAVMNERNTKSAEEIIDDIEFTKGTYEHYMYVDFVRMTNDAIRKDKNGEFIIAGNTEDEIMNFANGEFHNCVIYRF